MAGWRTIGVIGGMGPAATADFLRLLVAGVPAARDSDHPRILIDSNPQVPDRNAALAGRGPSPGPVLAEMAQRLMAQGAQVLAMPCNAAHGWAGAVRAVADDAFIDIVDAALAAAMVHRPARVGVIAIGATLDLNLYGRGAVPVVAADPARVQPLIDRIKAGDTGAEVVGAMNQIAADLVVDGADVVIAACTEVPLVLSAGAVPVPFVDTTAALAAATLAAARLA
ncbi:aspartate/glutamate racemase family protein [Polymorphobacter fuscus]|nr:amino acid racemase [Polymorphobacter fuscus]NJC08208.1 aspartate racemase [Polymorphobacter fuscus]